MFNDDSLAIYLMYYGYNNQISPISSDSIFRLLKQLYENGLTASKVFSPIDDSIFRSAGLSFIESDGLINLHKAYLPVKIELKRLHNNGINMVSIVDTKYPLMLKSKLRFAAPPILFYSGEISILAEKSISIVGQRDAPTADLRLTERIASLVAEEGFTMVSGGASGVDITAQTSALSHNGNVAVFYPFCLSSKVHDLRLLKWVNNGKLLMLSHTAPHSTFSAKNALTRNRYIHASGDFSIAICSKLHKGGTWSGAYDNLKNNFSPLFVCNTPNAGNMALIKMGGIALDCSFVYKDGIQFAEYLRNQLHEKHHKLNKETVGNTYFSGT